VIARRDVLLLDTAASLLLLHGHARIAAELDAFHARRRLDAIDAASAPEVRPVPGETVTGDTQPAPHFGGRPTGRAPSLEEETAAAYELLERAGARVLLDFGALA
jgi:hypothetical protein